MIVVKSPYRKLGGSVRRTRTQSDLADLIERFLQNRLAYPQEWNDFIECRESDPTVDEYRKKCYDLDPLVNRPAPIDEHALAELRAILGELRATTTGRAR
jgi:hypothetical protein